MAKTNENSIDAGVSGTASDGPGASPSQSAPARAGEPWIDQFIDQVRRVLRKKPDLRLDYMPLYISDFLADDLVQCMTTEAKGAYLLLLMRAWLQDDPASLPNDDALLCKLALGPEGSAEKWSSMRAMVMKPFVLGANGRLYQKRLTREWLNSANMCIGRKRGADKTNAIRRAKRKANAQRSAKRDAERTHKPNPTQPNPPGSMNPPNPNGDRGGGGAAPGVGKGGGSQGGNMDEVFRMSAVRRILQDVGVRDPQLSSLANNRHVTPERANAELDDIRRSGTASDIAGCLVHRLSKRNGRH